MQSANWSERLAGERANETVATISTELLEARAHIERLMSQLQSAENVRSVITFLTLVYLAVGAELLAAACPFSH